MKPGNSMAWPALDKLPPSIVFQTAEFLREEDGDAHERELLRRMVEMVENTNRINLREFIEPSQPPTRATFQELQRLIASFAAFISLIEHDALAYNLQHLGAADLLMRYQMVRHGALEKAKSTRAILVAALENAAGAIRNETPEERLSRAVEMAKSESPIDFGSFERFADEPDDES